MMNDKQQKDSNELIEPVDESKESEKAGLRKGGFTFKTIF